jgi:hypothetical protein
MRVLLRSMVVVIGIALLVFAVHHVASLEMGMTSTVLNAPQQLWYALGDATPWGVSYRAVATVVFIACLAVLYVRRVPPIHSKSLLSTLADNQPPRTM